MKRIGIMALMFLATLAAQVQAQSYLMFEDKTAAGVGTAIVSNGSNSLKDWTCQVVVTNGKTTGGGTGTAVVVDVLGAVAESGNYVSAQQHTCTLTNKLSRGTSADTALKNTTFPYLISGVPYYKASAETAFTATTHDVATGSKWASYRISVNTAGTVTITMSALNNYASEALAIAAVPATPTGQYSIGYITIQSTAGAIWNATTDALQGGASGTPAAATNYYSDMSDVFTFAIRPANYYVGQLTTFTGGATESRVSMTCQGVR